VFVRVLAFPVSCVTVIHRWRRRAPERAIIQYIGPDQAGFDSAQTGCENGNRGVIDVNALAAHDMPAQRINQRAEQTRCLVYHVHQRRTAEIDILSRVLFRLAMQWLVIAIFCCQDVSDQAGAGATALNGQVGHRCLDDRLTGPAGQFRPRVVNDPECARNTVKDLGLVRAQGTELAAACGATAMLAVWGGVFDDITRQR
jgi:hypothetical protein